MAVRNGVTVLRLTLVEFLCVACMLFNHPFAIDSTINFLIGLRIASECIPEKPCKLMMAALAHVRLQWLSLSPVL